MKAKRLTDDALTWAAYLCVPAENRLAESLDQLTAEAKATWLRIAKSRLGCGWEPPIPDAQP